MLNLTNQLSNMLVLPNLKSYYRPKSISEALALLEKNSGTILVIAGGTKLVLSENETVQELVDIRSLNLDYIKEDMGIIRIGATTPLQKLVESSMLKNLTNGIVSDAAQLTHYSKMIRNVSTLGGELVSTNPLSVLYCALLVLQAQVRIAGGEEFALAMNIFLNKKGLGGGLLIEILIPKMEPQTYAAIIPVTIQSSTNPLICACTRLTLHKGTCKSAKIAITGTQPVPKRLQEVESDLEGHPLTPAKIEHAADRAYEILDPISDNFASAEFRKEIARVVVKRALNQCLEYAEKAI
ncbi:MAG: FAD binding domain-containing protein [bacterium]